MKKGFLALLLLLMSSVAQAEEIFPDLAMSEAEYKKAWRVFFLADAQFVLGEYREAIETAKSAYRALNDIRILPALAVAYEEWAAHVSDRKEAFRLYQQASFLYERTQQLLPTVADGSPGIGWVRRTLEQRHPPLKEQLAKAGKYAQKSRHPPAHTVAKLEAELARTRDELAKKSDELAKERATRAALEQAVRALAAQKPEGPRSETSPIPVSAPYAAAGLRE